MHKEEHVLIAGRVDIDEQEEDESELSWDIVSL